MFVFFSNKFSYPGGKPLKFDSIFGGVQLLYVRHSSAPRPLPIVVDGPSSANCYTWSLPSIVCTPAKTVTHCCRRRSNLALSIVSVYLGWWEGTWECQTRNHTKCSGAPVVWLPVRHRRLVDNTGRVTPNT